MIRTAVLAALALGALASPAFAFEVRSTPAPHATAPHFIDTGAPARMLPATASESFHFGAPDQRGTKGQTVIYELSGGKPADRIDVTSARDNPFMAQPERSRDAAH